ncbi:hypothetical protein PVAND_016035 [Polypedilum vanderplanki]|uniref:Uncharacterized protein n=1 Tax=Polypedilum vanderplanki TaxID=319348 RepID=A0A9J6BEP1_POLVA|nr:hypothetical protein PVAND_016035 [Polypedilum vanderplanki]
MTLSENRRILTRVKVDRDDEIIISGISGRFPNSKNVEELSYNLYNKIDMVDDVERRWKHLNDEMPKRYGKTVNLEKFDASFFSINYKQAHNMDPQARILQEHAYEAIIDAGVAPKSLRGSRTGVFISCCMTEADEHFYFGTAIKDGMGLTGSSRALLANRISFSMDLKGPSFTIDSACSSSGYALDLAFNAIRTGECDAAIVGGSNLLLHPATTLQFYRLGVLSKDGYCRPFDKDATGYCRSEAVTVIFLQKRKDAKRIYGELVYSKTNIDGFKNEGLTYPSGKIQIKLLAEFYKDLGIDPKTIDYIEAHCTGTKVGDPEECLALDTIFCNDRTKPLPVGSVKSNMGHTEASSTLCSIIKSLLIFETKKIPPNIHFTAPRDDIPSLVDGRLKVVNEIEKFDGNLISVNSFGFGGANVHCLLKRNPKQKENRGIPKDDIPRLVLWSGRTEKAVNSVLENISSQPLDAEFIALLQNSQISNPSLNTYRGYGIYAKVNENTKCLAHHVNNFASSKRPIVFVYSGMGSQWSQMGTDLMKIPIFASTIEKCHNILIENQINLKEIITSSDTLIFENILNSFVGIAAIQIGLTNIMNAIGLKPDFVIGHSVGELGCAYADNCLTDEEMILCAYSRGMASLESKIIHGAMAAVSVGYDELKNMLIDGVEIACHNSSDSCTISGPSELIDVFVKKLKEKNIFAKKVQSSNIAYHSSYIAPAGSNLLQRLKTIIKNPKKRSSKWICSSVPKENWNDFDCRFSSAQYHSNNLLNAVLFHEASENLPKDALTIEIAPHGLLQSIIKRLLPDGLHFSLTKRGISDNSLYLIESLGKIFENGVDMDISAIYPQIEFPVSSGTPMISPLIKWDHTENWFVPKYDDKKHNDMQINISLQDSEFGFISGHEIDGRVLFPATGYLFLTWKLAALQNKEFFDKFDVEFEDVKFLRACNIPADPNGIELTVVVQRGSGKFEIIDGKNTVCTGIVRNASESKMRQFYHEDSKKIEVKAKDFYKELRLRGYNYKGLFKSVISSQSDGSSGDIKWQSNWIAFLDCLLQLKIFPRDTRSLVLPVGIKKLTIKTRDHLALASDLDKNETFKAFYCSKMKILQCGGVEIRGVQTQTVNRRPPNGIPILESYQFIPHYKNLVLSKIDIARFCIQLAIENFATAKISAVEIDMNDDKEPLCGYFYAGINEQPLITAELNYLTSRDDVKIPYVNVTNEKFSSFNNSIFVIRSNCLSDNDFMESIALQTNEKCFILTRESLESSMNIIFPQNVQIIAKFSSDNEIFVLLQYLKIKVNLPSNIIKITNDDFSWLDKLKSIAKSEPTIVYAENEEISGIIGLVNCIRKEPGCQMVRCFFIDDCNAPPFNIDDEFYKTQINKNLAMNVFRDRQWGSYKHLLLDPIYEKIPQNGACYANVLTRGDLSSFKWFQSHLTDLSHKNVVKVHCSSLNFRDVMLATGKLSADIFGNNRLDQMYLFGLEFSGITNNGRRVMGLRNCNAHATHILADKELLWDVPDNWTLEEAATVPCVYATVYASFFIATKIKSGKSILIHSGTGGVGLAAIQVALAYGLEVFTTVSTEEKKKFLLEKFPQLNYLNIGNSRDTSFEDLIMERTCGKGVDYVLNSLAEEKLLASLRCLSKGGTFFEIGKFDISNDNKLGLGEFIKEISFHTIFIDNYFEASSDKKKEIRELLDADIKKGIIKPLKMNVFNADEIVQAFKLLASGKHIGKVVLRIREMENSEKSVPISVLPKVYFNPNLCYIICGGLGGFGLELTDWLILRGCKNIILSSSRGITNDYQKIRLSLWKTYGVKVIISTSDITTRDGCIELITTASNLAPVGGIFNLAVKLRDGILENQDAKTFIECMAPKALATKYLHEVSRTRCPLLHEFVVFSSVSCGRGNAGQSNYGMANSVMERIIEQRHKIGLPGKAIQWGAIGEVGIVADMQEDKNDLEIGGTLQQRISSCLEVLDTLMTVKSPIVSSMVVAEKHNKNAGKDGIVKMILNIMSIKDVKSLSIETKLSELGMDSLMTVEISQALEREFNLYITSQELRSITLQQLNALEKVGHFDEIENQSINKFQFLLPSLDEEKEAFKSIIKLESNNDNGDKVLLITGVEGVGGKNYKNFARNLNNPTYLLQMSSCWYAKSLDEMYSAVVDDVLKLYENEKSFLLIGYSFGSILTLKLVSALESKGKIGKVILIDGSPKLMQQIVLQFLPSRIKTENDMENLVLKHYFRLIFPKERTDRLSKILQEKTWEEKMLKVEEILVNYNSHSEQFIKNLLFGLLQRIKIAANLNLKSFDQLSSPITLIKPNEITLHEIEDDYGLQIYTKNKIQINFLKGNHSNIIENFDLSSLVNKIFS